MTEHPTRRLEDTVHQRVRLGILAVLHESDRTAFTAMREALGQADGTLSKHLSVLEQAGYVAIEKGYEGRRPRTWVSLTDHGRAALDEQVGVMRELMAGFDRRGTEQDPALSALYAIGALLSQESNDEKEVAKVTTLGDVLIGSAELPDNMGLTPPSGPINQYGEYPPGRGAIGHSETVERLERASREAQARRVAAGLRGGYNRRFVQSDFNAQRDGAQNFVMAEILEWGDDETAAAASEQALPKIDADSLDVPDLPPTSGSWLRVHDQGPIKTTTGMVTFAIGRFSCVLSFGGGKDSTDHQRLVDLARTLTQDQVDRVRRFAETK